MSCEDHKYLIHDLVEDELDTLSTEEVNSHLIVCRACKLEFEAALGEKDFYSKILFEIEPPKNLVQNFQVRLENLDRENFAEKNPSSFSLWRETFFSVFRLKPILAAATVLIALGLFFLMSRSFIGSSEQELSGNNPLSKSQVAEKIEIAAYNATKPKVLEKSREKAQTVKTKAEESPTAKSKSVADSDKVTEKQIFRIKSADSKHLPKLAVENKQRIKELNLLQTETAVQFEKIELLLRSFRNASISEETRQFNVSYEQELARKLLNKNFQLRLQAAEFGHSVIAETLDNYEPYLLDIANLAKNPAIEDVLEIKQRMNNQNAILSLQAINY